MRPLEATYLAWLDASAYGHDEAAAVALDRGRVPWWFFLVTGACWIVISWVVLRHWPGTPSQRVARLLSRIAWGALAWVLLGGVVRVIFYREYEWLPRAGTAQIPALAVKHVVLVTLTVWGLEGVLRLQRLAGSLGHAVERETDRPNEPVAEENPS